MEELQRQVAELSSDGNNQATIEELQRQIAELSQGDNNQAELEELQQHVEEIKKEVTNFSQAIVTIECECWASKVSPERNLGIIKKAGITRKEAMMKIGEACGILVDDTLRKINKIKYFGFELSNCEFN